MTDAALFATSATAPAARACAHCGETIRGAGETAFCCAGCTSAHAIIGAAGLGSFYRRLEETRAHRPVPLDVDFSGYARQVSAGETELDLLIDGLDCAACVWLIESLLARNPTIVRARVSLSTRRLSLRWRGLP
ncbi:MAG: heavy metal translocating P-type ATPase metal-binding domain-containing protein, partial [Reyranella sp.]|nr:heavy metal translocating P-type ATPase metal-binding domain-containing protein [Reyranella sp.]